jgi:hypothetical protein
MAIERTQRGHGAPVCSLQRSMSNARMDRLLSDKDVAISNIAGYSDKILYTCASNDNRMIAIQRALEKLWRTSMEHKNVTVKGAPGPRPKQKLLDRARRLYTTTPLRQIGRGPETFSAAWRYATQRAAPRPAPRETREALPQPILRRMSRLRISVPRLAARRCDRLRLRAGAADIVDGRRWEAQRCFQGCAPEGLAIQYRLKYLLCCRCCQALLHTFFSPFFSGCCITSCRVILRLPLARSSPVTHAFLPIRVQKSSIPVDDFLRLR